MLKSIFVKLCIKTLDQCVTKCSEVLVTEFLKLCLTYVCFVNVSRDKRKSTVVFKFSPCSKCNLFLYG